MNRIVWIWFYVSLTLLSMIVSAGFLTTLWPDTFLPMVGSPLYRNDRPTKGAAAVVVLMGGVEFRPKYAASLVHEGLASELIMVECQESPLESVGLISKESNYAKAMALRAGIQESQIKIISHQGRATSTFDEAVILSKYFQSQSPSPTRLIIVTSWPHSARAGWILDKTFKATGIQIEMAPVEDVPFNRFNWWRSESGLIFVTEEYIKWIRYLFLFG